MQAKQGSCPHRTNILMGDFSNKHLKMNVMIVDSAKCYEEQKLIQLQEWHALGQGLGGIC